MRTTILSVIVFFILLCTHAQDKGNYSNHPFSIYKNSGKVVIAGSVKTVAYNSQDLNQTCTDPHSSPECLVNELFKNMKSKDIKGIANLYDTSFHLQQFNEGRLAMLKNYNSIKLRSKFKINNDLVVRYDFIGAGKPYPYFAALRKEGEKYYLTMDINLTDPFNVVGSYSPNNFIDRKEEDINIKNMTPFYFVHQANKIFFTNELPTEDYTALYFSFDFYNKVSSSAEIQFLKDLQRAAQSPDTSAMNRLLSPKDNLLLPDPYFHNYYYAEIKKIFKNFFVSPLASVKTSEGKVLYFRYSDNNTNSYIGSIILKQSGNKFSLALRITNDDVNNILQNVYIREAIYDYMRKRP